MKREAKAKATSHKPQDLAFAAWLALVDEATKAKATPEQLWRCYRDNYTPDETDEAIGA